jgi:hypothetical protein
MSQKLPLRSMGTVVDFVTLSEATDTAMKNT